MRAEPRSPPLSSCHDITHSQLEVMVKIVFAMVIDILVTGLIDQNAPPRLALSFNRG